MQKRMKELLHTKLDLVIHACMRIKDLYLTRFISINSSFVIADLQDLRFYWPSTISDIQCR